MGFSTDHLTADFRRLGVQPGSVLVVHTSLRNVGWVDDGPAGVIAALRAALGEDGTLVMPSMTDGETLYDPATTPTDGMGIVAETFWRLPGVLRSNHPSSAFASQGPLAAAITATHPLFDPQGLASPIGKVYQLDGWVLLLGVDHSENTTIHLAETLSNVPYRIVKRWPVLEDGVERWVEAAEIDHCCQNFVKLGLHLAQAGALITGAVGGATGQLMRSRAVVAAACALLADDPYFFLCPPGECTLENQCDEARAYPHGGRDRS